MQLKIFQKGFNFSQDGPGNRLVYHLMGCNLRCPWCSNPECFSDENYTTVSTDEIVTEAINCKPMFFENGGVTFTGGEATLQFEALKDTLSKLKENHISTAIETNGTSEKFKDLLPFIDYVIMDLKHPENEKHKEVTTVGNEIIKENIKLVSECKKNLLVRIPLINGFNTDLTAQKGFLDFFESLNKENTKFELLKYHEYGKEKWKKEGLEYTVKDAFVTEELRLDFERKMKDFGLCVIRT